MLMLLTKMYYSFSSGKTQKLSCKLEQCKVIPSQASAPIPAGPGEGGVGSRALLRAEHHKEFLPLCLTNPCLQLCCAFYRRKQ